MEQMMITSPIEFAHQEQALADQIFHQELIVSSTIGELEDRTRDLIATWSSIDGVHERLSEVQASLLAATEGDHGNIVLEDDLGSGVLGEHHFASRTSSLSRHQLNADQLLNDFSYVQDTVLHENDTDLGHAGQDPAVFDRLDIIVDGARVPLVTILEGNVVANVSEELGQTRDGLPQETYLEGQQIVTRLGVDEVDSYIRTNGAKNGEYLQTLVWDQNAGLTPEQMLEEGHEIGMDPVTLVREFQSRFASAFQPTTQSA